MGGGCKQRWLRGPATTYTELASLHSRGGNTGPNSGGDAICVNRLASRLMKLLSHGANVWIWTDLNVGLQSLAAARSALVALGRGLAPPGLPRFGRAQRGAGGPQRSAGSGLG